MLLRIIALLAVIAIGTLALSWAFTGEQKYLKYAWRLLVVALAAILLFLALLFLQRVVTI